MQFYVELSSPKTFEWPDMSSSKPPTVTFLLVDRFTIDPVIVYVNYDFGSIFETEQDIDGCNFLDFLVEEYKLKLTAALNYVKSLNGLTNLLVEWICSKSKPLKILNMKVTLGTKF